LSVTPRLSTISQTHHAAVAIEAWHTYR
jgi:hypothetical protein